MVSVRFEWLKLFIEPATGRFDKGIPKSNCLPHLFTAAAAPSSLQLTERSARMLCKAGGQFEKIKITPLGQTMFNLIMVNQELGAGPITLDAGRMFEHTEKHVTALNKVNNTPDFKKLLELPSLFMQEGTGDQIAYVGRVIRVQQAGQNFLIDHSVDKEIRPITNAEIFAKRLSYGMPDRFEFSRNHWAVKDADLFRLLLTHSYPVRQIPKVFTIPANEVIQPDLLSVMMPFDASFIAVYAVIRDYARSAAFRCQRADDIWNHDVIVQDVVALIDSSRIVICDCSGRNANVFYETGIAHTLGRDVILITQSQDDIPFDLRHLRYIRYLNNAEGHTALITAIRDRVATLVNR